MVRAGLFRDVDAVLHWHPGDSNTVTTGAGMLAVITAKFEFHGLASHAAAAPEKGRSALDGLMLMATAVEFLREHVPSATRIHYIVTKGGAAPNIVPDDAELFLYARHPSMTVLSGIWERILKCANGAAMATETTVECRIVSSDSNIVNNAPLGERVYHNFTEINALNRFEADAVAVGLINLQQNPIKGPFDTHRLQETHHASSPRSTRGPGNSAMTLVCWQKIAPAL